MPHRPAALPALPAELAIRLATPGDAITISALGARLFAQAYGPTHPDPELGEYLARAFQPADLARAMIERDTAVLLAEVADAGAIGYARIQPGAILPLAPWQDQAGCEVQRFYVDREWQGRGVARELMARTLQHAIAAGSRYLWLQVWQEADWAIRFYQRAGFGIVGTTPFTWGARLETDWLMARPTILEQADD